jgi:hypothetical protein
MTYHSPLLAFEGEVIFEVAKSEVRWPLKEEKEIKPKRIYNPITAMGFSAIFTFQLDNIKR